MVVHFKLDLGMLTEGIGENRIYLGFTNITNLTGSTETFTEIDMTWEWDGTREFAVLIDDEWEVYDEDTLGELIATGSGGFIEFDAEIITDYPLFISSLQTSIQIGFLQVNSVDAKTIMILYRLNDQRDHVNKNLTFIGFMTGNFKAPLGIKNIEIDVINYDINNSYNYIYIPLLKRYYYVTNIMFINNDYTRLQLQEDVLMSWASLIRLQNAFVTRCEDYNNKDVLIDTRLPIRDTISYNYYSLSNGTEKNVTFNFKQAEGGGSTGYSTSNYNILISTYTKDQYTNSSPYPIEAPSGSGLPDISPLRGSNSFKSLIQIGSFGALVNACVKDETTASFVQSVLWLPFNPVSVFPHTQAVNTGVHCNGKVLEGINGGQWTNYGSETTPVSGYWIHDGACPYLIVADFYFNSTGGIGDVNANSGIEIYPPISKWEIFVPFVGWVEVDINAVKNKRILVYYSMDLDTGLSTAYIYNRTNSVVIWSGTCQIGIRLNFATSNELENTKQKQANDLNMILGALSSVVSIGVGVATENPVAIVGGVLSASKTIASTVQSNSMIFDRANLTFGTSNTALYSKTDVQVRRSYHYLLPEANYAEMQGYPTNYYGSLSLMTGYTEVGEIHFDAKGENIYNAEIDEIVALLKGGVIL